MQNRSSMTLIRPVLLAASIAFAASAPLQSQPLARASATLGDPWQWQGRPGDRRALVLKLVRGSARVVRRAGPVELVITRLSPSGGANGVSILIEEQPRAVTIVDHYPARRLRTWTECLPPEDERGAFWDSDVVLDATVYAPEGVSVRAEIMDRQVGSSPAS